MRNVISFVLMYFMVAASFAVSSGFDAAVNEAHDAAQSKKFDSYNHAKTFDPQSVFNYYSKNPEQTKYYHGIKEKNANQMEEDGIIKKNNSEPGKDIANSINQHPRFVINKTDPSIDHSLLLQSEADNILHGVTSQYIDCKAKEACKREFEEKSCEEEPQEIFQSCKKTLNIDLIPHETITHYPLSIKVSTKEHSYAGINVNAVTGENYFVGPHDTRFTFSGRLPGTVDCRGLQGSVTVFNNNNRGTKLDHINFPSCSNNFSLDFHLSGSKTINLEMQIDIASKVVTYEAKDRWVDHCVGLLNESMCTLKSQHCDVPGGTREIEGISIARDCWQNKFNYICRHGSGLGNCKPLQSEGCEQIGSEYISQSNDQCTRYRQTYRCEHQSCSKTSDVICGNGQEYCLDGSCTDHSYQASDDFKKAVSALSAIADASKQFDPNSQTIFAGHPAECSEKPIGFSNCCKEEGWGQDLGLANCPEDAKKLHDARERKLTVKVGRYCSGSEPFPCLEHSQVFCVFNSKLARIIQENARNNFGSAKHPNCLGISMEQLQSLDLSKIDFKDFIPELYAKIKEPDQKQTQQMIQEHIEQYQKTGLPNG